MTTPYNSIRLALALVLLLALWEKYHSYPNKQNSSFFAVSCDHSDFTVKICLSSCVGPGLYSPLPVHRGVGMSLLSLIEKTHRPCPILFFSTKTRFLTYWYLSVITAKAKIKMSLPVNSLLITFLCIPHRNTCLSSHKRHSYFLTSILKHHPASAIELGNKDILLSNFMLWQLFFECNTYGGCILEFF